MLIKKCFLFLVLAFCSGGLSTSLAQDKSSLAVDLPNFHQVSQFLYRGGEPSENGLWQLKNKGITILVDLRAPTQKALFESSWAKKHGLAYVNLPMNASPPTEEQVNRFISILENAQKHPDQGSIFVHCAHGSDRTGCMIGIWRVTHEGWAYEKAYKEMRQYYFNPKFVRLSGAVKRYAGKT